MFLHPWMIGLAVAAAALPVVVHWLTRPRPVSYPLSTIRFVREAIAQRRARHRLRDIVILSLRTAAILLLGFAIARPLLHQPNTTSTSEAADVVRVVLLDVSQSMAAETSGVTALERGRSLAAKELGFRPGLRCNLILAAARPSAVFAGASTNLSALRESLSSVQVSPQVIHAQPALNAAAEMLAQAGGEDVRRELVIVSDFQRSNWGAVDFSTLPADTRIRLQSTSSEQAPGNLALLRAAAQGRAQVGQEARLEVELGNFTQAPINAKVEVRLGDAVYPLSGNCPPYSKTTLTTPIQIPKAGWLTGEAKLIDVADSLPADNRRPLVLQATPQPSIALITRQAEREIPSSSYYLERALSPSEPRESASRERVARISPDSVDRQTLAATDVIVVDHAGQLSRETVGLLASLLRRGKGMLYVASDPVDATNLKQLVDAAGPALRMPVEFLPAPVGQERRAGQLASIRRQKAPFNVFGDQVAALTSPLRFSGGLLSRKVEGGLEDDVLAAFADGSALLVASTSDSGSLAVLNTDLQRSNLPASPAFVPMIGELTRQLLDRRGVVGFSSGEPMSIALPASVENIAELSLVATADSSSETVGQLQQEPLGIVWHAAAAPAPGTYTVQRAGETVHAVATGIPESEADLRTLPAEVFEERLAGQRDVRFHRYSPVASEEQDTLWSWLVVACVGCVLGEIAALRWFRMS